MDAKTSRTLTKTYAIVGITFVIFSCGLGMSILYNNVFLAVLCGIFSTIVGLFTLCLPSPTQKLTCLSIFAIGMGYLSGSYCLNHGLETHDIVFCGFVTFLTFICASFAALFTRSMIALYCMTAVMLSISYIPVMIFYFVAGGTTSMMLIGTMGVLGTLLWMIIDTIKVVKAIENGVDNPFELAMVIFTDIVDLFLDIARLMIMSKIKSKKDDDD